MADAVRNRKGGKAEEKERSQKEKSQEKKGEGNIKEPGSSFCRKLLFLLFIIGGIFGYLFFVQKFRLKELQGVKRVEFEVDEKLKTEMLSKREPMVLSHAVPSNSELTHLSFLSPFPEIPLSKAQRSPSGIFAPFDSEAPLLEASYLATTGSVDDVIEVLAGEFWRDPNATEGIYYYYDAPTHVDFKKHGSNLPKGLPLDKRETLSPRFTFASQGARTKPFSFLVNSYLAVLDGAVDVILFAPSEIHHLYPYPEYHPNAGSGQVLFQENVPFAERFDILRRFPEILKAKGFKVHISAGDVLYIPPFWFSQLSFKKPSILLKTFSSMYESEVLHDFLHLQIPHTDNLDSEIFIVKKLIDWFIPLSLGSSADAFISNLVTSRYLPLYQDLAVETSTDFSSCHQEDLEMEKEIKEFSERHLENVKKLSGALDELPAVRLIALEQYVEYLVQKTISAEDAYNFYLQCFNVGLRNSRSSAQDIE